MFNNIRDSYKPFPWVTTVYIGCTLIVTLITVFIPNLQEVFGSYRASLPLLNRSTIVFQQGFDEISAIIQLITSIIFLLSIGFFVEKVLGSFRFAIITATSMLIYLVIHRVLEMEGNGSFPIIFTYVPFSLLILAEGKRIKTRAMFEEHYRTMMVLTYVFLIGMLLLMPFIPIYFSLDTSLSEAAFRGNVLNIACLLFGVIASKFFYTHMKERLKYFHKKRKFPDSTIDQFTKYLLIVMPVYILLVFFMSK